MVGDFFRGNRPAPMIWVGVAIALVGALGYALGAAIQQFEAVRDGARSR